MSNDVANISEELKDILPDYPGVMSLCIKCVFCKGINLDGESKESGMNTMVIVDNQCQVKKILIPGTYTCNNPKSQMYQCCIVGHSGCMEASQIQDKEAALTFFEERTKGKGV